MDAEQQELLKVAAREWRDGKMSASMFCEIAWGYLFPQTPDAKDMEWAKGMLRLKGIMRGDK